MKCKLLSAVLAVVLLFGCGAPAAGVPPQPLLDNLYNETAIPRELIFLVDSGGDPVYRQAAEVFAQKVSQLTDGVLNVQVLTSVQPVADFVDGKARFAFVDGQRNSDFSLDFPLLNRPMLYENYQRFTMALNNPRMLSALSEPLQAQRNATLLAAFYQSPSQLISNRPPTDGVLPFVESDGRAYRGLVCTDSGLEAALLEYGLGVEAVSDRATRVQRLLDEEVLVAEFTADELRITDWQDQELYLLNTNHGASARWLVTDSELYSQLTPVYRAAIQEALAYLFPIIDDFYLERDARLLPSMANQGVHTEERFSALKGTADMLLGQETAADYRKKYLIDLLLDVG